jgi:hypothetical protein
VDTSSDDANCGACGQACAAGTDCSAGGCVQLPAAHYVFNQMLVPLARTDYAIDLNGDGHVDNQLGNIIGALAALMFDVQGTAQAAVASGASTTLVELRSADPQLKNDPSAHTLLERGAPVGGGPSDFTGMGQFVVDLATPAGAFTGALINGTFKSANPVTTNEPVSFTLQLGLFSSTMVVELPLNGAHVQFTTGTDAASGAPGLLQGEIHGSIKNADVQSRLVPAIAQLLSAKIQADPTSATAKMIEQLFDTGNCINADGTMAVAGDGRIDPCEVASNAIIQNVLAPDVQIYDANGNYAPNPANTQRDSLSVGLGFTAVQANF